MKISWDVFLVCQLVFVAYAQSNIVFVGVFPFHIKSNNLKQSCSNQISYSRGIQAVEGMFYAIDKVNQNANLLKNIKLKWLIIDSCDDGTVALERFTQNALQKIRGTSEDNCPIPSSHLRQSKSNDVYAGVIGAASSPVSMALANLLRLFKVPQISYASTSDTLCDRIKYKYFTRTVPPDTQQLKAMLDLARYLGWTTFSMIYSEGSYGENAFEALKQMAGNGEFCLMDHFKVNAHTNYSKIVETFHLPRYRNTRLVILFCAKDHIKLFLNQLPIDHDFTILASDSWGNRQKFLDTHHLRAVANGALAFQLRSPKRNPDFIQYLQNLNYTNNKRNRWYAPYLNDIGCGNTSIKCAPRIITMDDKVPYVMDAVYALAHSLDVIYRQRCPAQIGLCDAMRLDDLRPSVMQKLYNLTYYGAFGRSTLNENGSANTGYELLRHQSLSKRYQVMAVWNGSLMMDNSPLKTIPYKPSSCFSKCSANEIQVWKAGFPKCCFDCVKCKNNQYRLDERTCASCEFDNQRPNATGNGCIEIPIRHLPSSWVIVVAVLSAVGILITVAIILIFYYHKETEVVRMSAPELSFPLLIGVILLYSLVFMIIADQSPILCGARRFGVGFVYCICFSAILTKANRLARVFNEKIESKRPPRFLSAISQLVIMSILVLIEATFATIALVYRPPELRLVHDTDNISGAYFCYHPKLDIIIAMGYDLSLLLICAYYAFRTRKIPAAFNEAKHLGVITYLHFLIFICFAPVYLVEVTEDVKTLVLSTCIFLCATSIVVVLFGPKIYIIILRPARNARSISVMSYTTSHSHSIEYDSYQRKATICSSVSRY